MGLLAKITQLVRRFRSQDRHRQETDDYRRCRFETMEPRRLLDADPIRIGAVYIEEDSSGADLHGDTFELTFVGGAPNTQLNRVVINGDQGTPGFGNDDVFFDTSDSGFGADHGMPFQIISIQSKNPLAAVTASVTDGTSLLTLDFSNFEAGDKLVFTIDVDEVEDWDPSETDLTEINDGFDPITSGVEFQTSKLTGYFSAQHYHDINGTSEFRNKYDDSFSGSGLNLPADDFNGKRDRSDGAIVNLQQVPLPVSISGTVYMEKDLDLVRDNGESGIGNVELSLWQKQGNSYSFTGHTTHTDSAGRYEFGTDLNLLPGTYQVRETQPTGLFSVGAIPGTVDGSVSGTTVAGNRDILTEINIPLGDQHSINNDFAEAEPVRISGYVYHDRSNDGSKDSGEEGLNGVAIQVIPVNTISTQAAVGVQTNADGFYEVTGLSPGTYRIVESVQPAGFFDGLDRPGTVNGVPVGTVVNPGDSLEQILLSGGQVGVNYNFGELAPVSLSGRVGLTDEDGNCDESTFRAVTDATVRLLDPTGKLIAETRTDENGEYQFTGLHPGQYSLVELTPEGLIDADARAGTINGVTRGQVTGPGSITQIVLGSGQQGIDYEFCEHEPSSISGFVYHDENESAAMDGGESVIEGTTVTLVDSNGDTVGTQLTDEFGYYEFVGLSAGTYAIVESQPNGWLDGQDAAGQIDGVTVGQAANPGDRISGIELRWGEDSTRNDFGELLPGSISGQVHLDTDGDCILDENELALDGVTIELLDGDGNVLQTTQTDTEGRYSFTGLTPGEYGIRELQPEGVYHGDQKAGSHGGDDSRADLITNIRVGSGQFLVDYNFCELPPASIAGMVFSDPNGDCVFNEGDSELSGVVVQLLNSQNAVVATTTTDTNGRYKFEDLAPGSYSVRELQPDGFFHGGQTAGSGGGNDSSNDLISQILVSAGQDLVDYNFCEVPPSSLGGLVFSDPNGDCTFNEGDTPLSGVTVELLDESGAVVGTEQTDSQGKYMFDNLAPGSYSVRELQPVGYFHGGQTAGTGGGNDFVDDFISQILVSAGQDLVDYNFCEVPPSSLGGRVFSDPNGDCTFNSGDAPLAGITVELLNESGAVVGTEQTDTQGKYMFDNLAPGVYSVRELQPTGYFQGGETTGTAGGSAETNLITGIRIDGGQDLVDYDFCESPPARIEGTVFQDGPTIQATPESLTVEQIGALRDGRLTNDDTRLSGVTLQLRDGFTGRAIDASEALPGRYAPGPIQVKTDANGHYEFVGIPGGRSYAIYEIHPSGFIDGIDTVGSTTGFAFNPQTVVEGQVVLEPLAGQPASDAIIRIGVAAGNASLNNNFSEVKAEGSVVPPTNPPPPITFPPPPVFTPPLPPPVSVASTRTAPMQSVVSWVSPRQNVMMETFAASIGQSWHLSVINGGMPRDIASASETDEAVWLSATHLDQTNWDAGHMEAARWVLGVNAQSQQKKSSRSLVFGIRGSTPITGDFNGDGTSEIGVFYRGEWFVDLNGDGVWNETDMWAKLGDELDRPVVGDWDGDGKDDIGIYGPEWYGDQRQIVTEQGLPDSQNLQVNDASNQPKNVPPTKEEATDGERLLRLHAEGPRRADVIDHVFRYGDESDMPVSGDWNGDGIRTVGVFRGGQWRLDVDGDGLAEQHDTGFHFGAPGDIPLVGDWDGNGVEEIGLYRSGQWIFDVNGNRELDAHDKIFQMGGAADRPVVGDWNGDGVDEPGLYREIPPETNVSQ